MRHLSFLVAALGAGCGDTPERLTPVERTIQLAYSNNVGGDIEPCG